VVERREKMSVERWKKRDEWGEVKEGPEGGNGKVLKGSLKGHLKAMEWSLSKYKILIQRKLCG
jgi:hypothetical protein